MKYCIFSGGEPFFSSPLVSTNLLSPFLFIFLSPHFYFRGTRKKLVRSYTAGGYKNGYRHILLHKFRLSLAPNNSTEVIECLHLKKILHKLRRTDPAFS